MTFLLTCTLKCQLYSIQTYHALIIWEWNRSSLYLQQENDEDEHEEDEEDEEEEEYMILLTNLM